MRFGIDLDGVLCDFTASVVDVANALWPGKLPKNFVADNWNYEGHLTPDEWDQIWVAIKKTPYFWENELTMVGATELQAGIKNDDEVFFITARTKTIGEPPAVQSARWLSHRRLYPRACYSTVLQVNDPKHKQDLFRGLDLKFMLDDYAPTVVQLNKIEGMHAFVLDQPWNRYEKDLPRVFSVTEYLSTIRSL